MGGKKGKKEKGKKKKGKQKEQPANNNNTKKEDPIENGTTSPKERCSILLSLLSDTEGVKFNKNLFFLLLQRANMVYTAVERIEEFSVLAVILGEALHYKEYLSNIACLRSLLKGGLTYTFDNVYYSLSDMGNFHERIEFFSEDNVQKAIDLDFEELFANRWKLTEHMVSPRDMFLRVKLDISITNRLYELYTNNPRRGDIPLYEVEDLQFIGQGGFGKVYRGTHDGTTVAVKFLVLSRTHYQFQSTFGRELVDFAREIEIVSRLRSPFIVDFLAVDPLNLSFVMSYIEGGDLQRYLLHDRILPWSIKLSIASQIVSGLKFLHNNNILHCDIKSTSMLVHVTNGLPNIKISDFGLSRYKQADMEESIGTLSYMAPELFVPPYRYSVKSDIYAFGVLLWEIALQRIPYEGNTNTEIQDVVLNGRSFQLPLEELNGSAIHFVRKYVKLITVCTEQDPRGRYPIVSIAGSITRLQMQCFLYEDSNNLAECREFLVERELNYTLLHYAAIFGKLNIAERLLNAEDNCKIGVNVGTWTKLTPLYLAAKYGHLDIVNLLLLKSALQLPDENGNTPLMVAAMNGHAKVVEVLLNYGANLHTTNHNEESPLFLAAGYGHFDTVQKLLEKGASFKGGGKHLLQFQANSIKFPVLSSVETNSKALVKTPWFLSPLHNAAYCGQVEVVSDILCGKWFQSRRLVDEKSSQHIPSIEDINLPCGPDHSTPLKLAIEANHIGVVAVLLNHKAIGKYDNYGEHIKTAACVGNTQLVDLLLVFQEEALEGMIKEEGRGERGEE